MAFRGEYWGVEGHLPFRPSELAHALGIDFLYSGATGAAWTRAGAYRDTQTWQRTFTASGVGSIASFPNALRSRLSAGVSGVHQTTQLYYGSVGAADFTGSVYHGLFGMGNVYGVADRGGFELGIGGDLGEGADDYGRAYVVYRSPAWPNNETLAKTTTQLTKNLPVTVVAMANRTVFGFGAEIWAKQRGLSGGYGAKSVGSVAYIGANSVDVMSVGSSAGPDAAALVAHFSQNIPERYIGLLLNDPWLLVDPFVVSVYQAAAGGLPALSLSTYKPGTLTSSGWTARITAS